MHQTLPAHPRPSLLTPDSHFVHQTLLACPSSTSHAPDPYLMHQILVTCIRPSLQAPDPHCTPQTHISCTRPSLRSSVPCHMDQTHITCTSQSLHAPNPPCTPQTHISCIRLTLQAPAPYLLMQHPKVSLVPWGIAGARAALQLTFYYLMASCSISKGTREHPSGLMSRVLCSLLPTRSALWLSHRTHCWAPVLLIKSQGSHPLWATGTLCCDLVPEDANPGVQGSQGGGQRGSARAPISEVLQRAEAGDVVCGR